MSCTSLCLTTSSPPKVTKAISRISPRISATAGPPHRRAEPQTCEEHLHLLGSRILSLVQDDEGVVEGATPHVGQGGHLDRAPIEVAGKGVGIHHVVKGVEQRPQVRGGVVHEAAGGG